MIISITLIKLKTPLHYFRLVFHYLKIAKQANSEHCLLVKSSGLWTTFYTLTQWQSMEDLKRFMRKGNHLRAMKISSLIAMEIRTHSFETTTVINWREAKRLVNEKGKVIKLLRSSYTTKS